MTNQLDHAAIERMAEGAIGHYGWLIIAAFVTLLFKDILFNFAQGLMIYWGSSLENDEVLYISGRQARVIRMGVFSCTFFLTDRQTKMIVPCSQLKHLTVEKKLPLNGGEEYLPKGNEKDAVKVKLIDDKD